MTIEIFPASPVPSFDYEINSEFKTLVSEFDSGAEQRRMLRRFPKRIVGPLNYKFLYEADRKILQNFFQQRGGPFASFWFVDWIKRNWVDEYVGRGIWYAMGAAIANDYPAPNTDETAEANDAVTGDMTLLPAAPAVNDSYNFGCDEMFDQLRLVISTPGSGTWTIQWQYHNGSYWTLLPNVSDGTNGFHNSGTCDVKFDRPADWVKCMAGTAYSGYYIRAIVAAFVNCTTAPKGTQAWTALRQYDLHGKNILGPELLTNCGMESGNPPTGWSAVLSPEAFVRSSAKKHGGSYSAEIIDSTPSFGGFMQPVAKVAGKSYRFSGWYYVVQGVVTLAIINGNNSAATWSFSDSTKDQWLYKEGLGVETVTGSSGGARYTNGTNTQPANFYGDDISLRECLLVVYADGVQKAMGTDYFFLEGSGEAGVDQIRFVNAPANGALITSDFEGYLRIKARFKDDKFPELMNAPLLFNHQFPLYEVQW